MRVHQFWEFGKDLHNLVRTFTASGDNYDVSFRLFGNSMLKHRLPCTERTRYKAGTTFHNRIQRINHTHTGFQQFERTRFLLVIRHGTFHRPPLNHSHRNIISFLISQDSNRILNLIITFRHDSLYSSSSLQCKRRHHFQRLEVLIHLPQPRGSLYFITRVYQWNEVPYTFFIQRIRILSSLQKNPVHLVKVILQTVVVFR